MTAPTGGFRVANAYINVTTEDDTRRGRDNIERDTSIWARALGGKIGGILGMGLAGGIASAMMSVLGGLLQVSKYLVIAAAVGAAAQAIAALGVALAQTAGIIPLAVPAILSLVSVFAALKIALSGFGAAVKAAWEGGDIDKLNELLKKLSPSAQAAVKSIVALKPALTAFKLAVQEAAFKGLAADIQVLAATYLPMLQTHMSAVASIFNGLVHDLVKFFTAKDVIADWVKTFGNLQGIIKNIFGGIVGILDGFRHIGVVAAPILERITQVFASSMNRFADAMEKFRNDGTLSEFIEKGVKAFGQLFDLLTNIWFIISPIFHIIAESGGDVLQMMIDLTGQFARFLTSGQATAAITGVLQALNQVLIAIGPGLLAVLGGLGQALIILGPAFGALGEAIGAGLVALAPALTVAAQALVLIITALAPILPIVAKFIGVLVEEAAPVLVALAPIITSAFQMLYDLLVPLLPLVGQLLLGLTPLVQMLVEFVAGNFHIILGVVVALLAALVPVVSSLLPLFLALWQNALMQLAPILVDIAETLGPVVVLLGTALFGALGKLLPKLIPILGLLIEKLLPVVVALAPVIAELAMAIADILVASLDQIIPLIEQFIGPLVSMVISILPSLVPLIFELARTFIELLPLLGPIVLLFLKLAIILLPPLIAALPGLLSLLATMLKIFNDFVGPAASFLGWLIGLTDKLIDLQWMLDAATKSFGAFRDAVVFVWNLAWDMLVSGPVKALVAFKDWVAEVIHKTNSLPGLIWGLFTGAETWLFNAGRDIVFGLWRGIQSLGGMLKDNVKALVKWAIPVAVQRLLGIDSPSKVMAELGQWVPKGLAKGMDAGLGTVSDAATRLAAAAMPALQSPGLPGASGGSLATSGYGADNSGRRGDTYVLVDLGAQVRAVLKAIMMDQPEAIAAGSDEGRRVRSFLNPARGGF